MANEKIFLFLLLLSAIRVAQIQNTLSPAEKVYGLSKFWQEVNYNFVYINQIDRKAWDSAYKPGGGSARVCTKKDTYPDGREFVGFGVKPDIEVRPTIADYLLKKDPVLEKALSYLGTKLK